MSEKIELVVVVNGQSTQVDENEESLLLAVVEKALEQTGNTGQPPDNWELRNALGVELDVHVELVQHVDRHVGFNRWLDVERRTEGS